MIEHLVPSVPPLPLLDASLPPAARLLAAPAAAVGAHVRPSPLTPSSQELQSFLFFLFSDSNLLTVNFSESEKKNAC